MNLQISQTKKFKHNFKNQLFPEIQQINTDSGRYYNTGENIYPSITTFLSHFSKDGIDAWKRKVGEEEANRISQRSADRGTRLHRACELYLLNSEIERNVFQNHMTEIMFLNMIPHLNKIDDVMLIETMMFSDHLKLAGTVDCVARFDGKKSIIDFKTSGKPKEKHFIKSYFLQATAYSIMFEEMTGIAIPNIVIMIAVEGAPTQIFQEKRDNFTKELLQWRKEYAKFCDGR